MSIQPFTIAIPQATLDDLRERLARTRWPDAVEGAGWEYGANLSYMQELVAYWLQTFDWRAQEAKLNQFAHFKADIDGVGIHFIHERGKGPAPLPLILTHGWPDSFHRMHRIIPLLTDPASYGGDPADAFDVIVPSLPGYGFSDRLGGESSLRTIELFTRLMTDVLGYKRFGAEGGDIGSRITRLLGLTHPEALVGIHLTGIGIPGDIAFPQTLDHPSPAEQQFLAAMRQWYTREGAYAALHSTKPQTISYSLNDSPVGLASWLVEKFRTWSDCAGDVEKHFSKDELLTHIMIYWATQTISSSVRLYYADGHAPQQLKPGQHIEVPAGVALFPKDLSLPPRETGERFLRVQHWVEMPRGGHFAAWEEPQLLAEDLRTFFRPLR